MVDLPLVTFGAFEQCGGRMGRSPRWRRWADGAQPPVEAAPRRPRGEGVPSFLAQLIDPPPP